MQLIHNRKDIDIETPTIVRLFETQKYIRDSKYKFVPTDGQDYHIRHLIPKIKLKYPCFPKRERFNKEIKKRKEHKSLAINIILSA